MSPESVTNGTIRQRAIRIASRLRFTLLFLATMLVANIASGSTSNDLPHEILEAWGIGWDAVASGDVFRLVTGTFLAHDPDMFLRQIVFAATVIGYTEWQRGSLRTAALFFGLDLVGTLALLALVGWSAGLAQFAATNDVGMSIGGFGLIGLAIAGWQRHWLVLSLVLLAVGVKYGISPDPLADLGHILALGFGFAFGSVLQVELWCKTREATHAR